MRVCGNYKEYLIPAPPIPKKNQKNEAKINKKTWGEAFATPTKEGTVVQ